MDNPFEEIRGNKLINAVLNYSLLFDGIRKFNVVGTLGHDNIEIEIKIKIKDGKK